MKFLILISLSIITFKCSLDKNIKFESYASKEQYGELSLELFYGNVTEDSFKLPQKFLFDIGLNYTATGDFSTDNYKWGVDCSQVNCRHQEIYKFGEEFYFSNHFTYSNKLYYLRFKDGDEIEDNDYEKTLKMRFISQNTREWRLGKVGLLGLGANNEFVNYLFKAYNQTEFSIGFLYSNDAFYNMDQKLKDKKEVTFDDYEINNYSSYIYFNTDGKGELKPKSDKDVKKYTYDFSKVDQNDLFRQSNIHIENSSITFDKSNLKTRTDTNICLINTSEDVILLMEFQVWTNQIMKMMCVKDKCDIKKAPTITVKLNNDSYKITPQEYLTVKTGSDKKKHWTTRFGDISAYLDTYCQKGTELALGRGFFEKRGIELKYYSTKKQIDIQIYDTDIRIKPKSSIAETMLIVYIILIVVFLLIILVFIFLNKGKKDKGIGEDFYVKENNEE